MISNKVGRNTDLYRTMKQHPLTSGESVPNDLPPGLMKTSRIVSGYWRAGVGSVDETELIFEAGTAPWYKHYPKVSRPLVALTDADESLKLVAALATIGNLLRDARGRREATDVEIFSTFQNRLPDLKDLLLVRFVTEARGRNPIVKIGISQDSNYGWFVTTIGEAQEWMQNILEVVQP